MPRSSSGESVHAARFDIEHPELWWPAGSGAQALYPLEIVCGGDVVRRRIGLRRLELLTDPDEAGARFAFRVNGREIFCRGANWIPADALPSRATPELTRKLLAAALDANMNMIRVWGGGFYEQDFFYDLCDELGLLVWQDFMFACNLYPSTPDFLAEVRAEVDHQVRRLGSHASIAMWCGDNELVGALTWFEESRKQPRPLSGQLRSPQPHDRRGDARPPIPSAIWWPSSPSPGTLSFGDAWHDDSSGDMHFWSVWHEGKDFEHYRDVRPRFCSEFGFQSFPSSAVIRSFATGDDDLNIVSPVMEWHQKNAGGNARIAETMLRYFRFPAGFREFRLSQPDPAGPGDQDGGRILALAEAALHGHALLAAQRHLAGRVVVEPRSRRRLEGAALYGAALLLAGRGVHRSRQGVGACVDRGGQRRQCAT